MFITLSSMQKEDFIMWICKKCDHENSEEAICCSNCGKKRQQRVLNKSLLLDVIAVVGILCTVDI